MDPRLKRAGMSMEKSVKGKFLLVAIFQSPLTDGLQVVMSHNLFVVKYFGLGIFQGFFSL